METDRAMERLNWQEEKEKIEKESLERHARLSKLFKEDRLSFERERKRMIDQVINSTDDEEQRKRLRDLQTTWDRRMKAAGSSHNRFVLAQSLFWSHFHETWHPAIKQLNSTINNKTN